MQENVILVNNSEKFGGMFVALKSFMEKDVTSFGKDPLSVYKDAKNKGIDDPVIFYIPEEDEVMIYICH